MKKVKAWIVLDGKTGLPYERNNDWLDMSLEIYTLKKDALDQVKKVMGKTRDIVLPCEISYNLKP